MLTNVPTAINSLARNVVINHPNAFNAVMVRKRVTRTAATSVMGYPTLGGLGVISSEDEESIEWDLLGNAYALETEMFTPGMMMDRQDANNGGIDEFRFLIEPETMIGNGTGALLTPVVTAGVVTSVTVTAGGTGYMTGQKLAFTGTGTGAIATVIAINGIITSVVVSAGGTGYTLAPSATIDNFGFAVKKQDVMYLVLGAVRLAYEITGAESLSNIPPYNQRFITNRRDDLHLVI